VYVNFGSGYAVFYLGTPSLGRLTTATDEMFAAVRTLARDRLS